VTLDNRVAVETLIVPLGFDQLPVYEWGCDLLNGLPIELTRVE
jgi:hypothetical protein